MIEGSPVSTFDLDIVHDRAAGNVSRLSRALREMQAYYRARPGSHLEPTAAALVGEGHHLFLTKFGPLDVLGVIGHGRDYTALLPQARRRKLGRFFVRVLDLETQIAVKEEVGHQKDRVVLPLLRETLRMRKKRP